jgi:hypothetical protein
MGRTIRTILAVSLVCVLGVPFAAFTAQGKQAPPGPDTSRPVEQSAPEEKSKIALPGGAPNGKRLILKDGNFQLVREYTRNGERVRYFSLERGAWEEIPASMIDWAATQKVEAATAARDKAELEKLKKQEDASRVDMVLDVDASLQTASGVFLPSGDGMFAVEGKKPTLLEQAGVEAHRDKKQFLKQIASPIPIVPSKTNIELPGAHAKTRLDPSHLEFYLREAPPDPDRPSVIQQSSRPGESGPEVELVRVTVKGNKRVVEQIKALFGQEIDQTRKTVLLQRWQIAGNVFRFTLGEPLEPGEYVLAEILPDGINLYVWDFGVDGTIDKVTTKK